MRELIPLAIHTLGFAGFSPVQATLTLRIRKSANLEFSGQYTIKKGTLPKESFLIHNKR